MDIRTRTCAVSLDVGRQLAMVKKLLPHGQFTAWAEAELGMTARTAQNLMVAAAFVEGKPDSVSHLPVTVLYRLGAASAPELIEEVVTTAEAGAPLDVRLIKERLETARLERVERKRDLDHARRRYPRLTPSSCKRSRRSSTGTRSPRARSASASVRNGLPAGDPLRNE